MANCYACIHRREVPGNCHIACALFGEGKLKFVCALLLESKGVGPYVAAISRAFDVSLNERGVRHGWCCWPILFDPVWVEKCPYYTEKPKKQKEGEQR